MAILAMPEFTVLLASFFAFLKKLLVPRPLCPLRLLLHFLQRLLYDFLKPMHLLQQTTILLLCLHVFFFLQYLH